MYDVTYFLSSISHIFFNLPPPLSLSLPSFSLAKCIDHYTHLCVENYDNPNSPQKDIDPRLESIVNRMFEKCFGEGHYHQAAGIAFETRRIDILERAILEAVGY